MQIRIGKYNEITTYKYMTSFNISDCDGLGCFAPACNIYTICKRKPWAQCRLLYMLFYFLYNFLKYSNVWEKDTYPVYRIKRKKLFTQNIESIVSFLFPLTFLSDRNGFLVDFFQRMESWLYCEDFFHLIVRLPQQKGHYKHVLCCDNLIEARLNL